MSYSPTMGRSLQRDPLGYVDGASLYQYVRGKPLEGVDPLGLRGRDTGSPVGGEMHSGPHGGDPLNAIGKIWNSPNTVIGLGWGTAGWIFSGGKTKVKVAHNQIAFIGHPLMSTAITLGNVGVYVDEDVYEAAWPEEEKHTVQGEVVGPLDLLLHLIGGVAGIVSHPSATGLIEAWHGPGNFMETGPMDYPPYPWPWDSSVDDCP